MRKNSIKRQEKGISIWHIGEVHLNTDKIANWVIDQVKLLNDENITICIYASKSMIDVYICKIKRGKTTRIKSFQGLAKVLSLGNLAEGDGGKFRIRRYPKTCLFSFTKNHTRVNFIRLPFEKVVI